MTTTVEERRHSVYKLGKDLTALGLILKESAYKEEKIAFTDEELARMLAAVLASLTECVLCTSDKCDVNPRAFVSALDRRLDILV